MPTTRRPTPLDMPRRQRTASQGRTPDQAATGTTTPDQTWPAE